MATTSTNTTGVNAVEPIGESRQKNAAAKPQSKVPSKATEAELQPTESQETPSSSTEHSTTRKKPSIVRNETTPQADAAKRVHEAPPTAPLSSGEIANLLQEERKRELLRSLNERYVLQGDEYRFRGDPRKVAFRDEGKRISTALDHPSVARSIVDAAEAKGWSSLRVSGTDDFKRVVWMEATVRGVKALGYEPTAKEREAVEAERLARSHTPVKAQAARPPATARDAASAQDNHGQASHQAAAPSATADRASGTLLEHGPARYRFDPQESPSYYVKLTSRGQERIVWGKQLGDALESAGAKVGDRISVRVSDTAVSPVEKNARDNGKSVDKESVDASRQEWSVKVLGRSAVAKVLDKALAKQPGLSAEARARVIAAGLKRVAQLEAAGSPKLVKVYDATAARTVQRPTPQHEPVRERTARAR